MSDNELPEGEVGQHAAFLLWQQDKQKQLIAEMEDRHSAFLSEFTQFLSELTVDQARMVREILERCSDHHVRIELAGITIGAQVFIQGLTVEGKDANVEWAKLMEDDQPQPDLELGQDTDPNPPQPDEVFHPIQKPGALPAFDDEDHGEELIPPAPLTDAGNKVLAMYYNLEEQFTPGGKSKGFMCKKCKKVYVSVEDRVDTEERFGGCQGCMHLERWG